MQQNQAKNSTPENTSNTIDSGKTISFEIVAKSGNARAAILTTKHGIIKTPAFVPVGTKASIKGILPELLPKLGAQVVLANTYHLYLTPGEKIVEAGGGLAKFMGWRVPQHTSLTTPPASYLPCSPSLPQDAESTMTEYGPTMTDSGGFQVFSLGAAFGRNITKIAKGEELPNDVQENTRDY
jgi:queuine tRNA-ribosyltransferase